MKNFIRLFVLCLSLIVLYSCDDNLSDGESFGESEALYGLSDAFSGEGRAGSASGQGDSTIQIEAGQITAGEWNDLTNWEFWIDLIQRYDSLNYSELWGYDVSVRLAVNATDESGNPIVNEEVKCIDASGNVLFKGRTDYKGMAELWPSVAHSDVDIDAFKLQMGGKVFDNVKVYEKGTNFLTVPGTFENSTNSKIDIAFVVDATGSMSDELEYLKVELVDVIDQVKAANSGAKINTATVFYRDEGDDYVTRKSPFTQNVASTVSFIKEQSAGGGGDFPEAVHAALDVAVNDLQWSTSATSRILFLLLDAPPHKEDQILSALSSHVLKASEMGIKIIPITASGIDKETEFLMRYMAMVTNGTYVFITNNSGIGDEHIEPTVGQYEVEYLNELMVRLINNYLE